MSDAKASTEKSVFWDTNLVAYGTSARAIEFSDGGRTVKRVKPTKDSADSFRIMIYGAKNIGQDGLCQWTLDLSGYDPSFLWVGISNEQKLTDHWMKPARPNMVSRSTQTPDTLWFAPLSEKAAAHKAWKRVVYTADLKTGQLRMEVDGHDFGTPFNCSPDKAPLYLEGCTPAVMFYRCHDTTPTVTMSYGVNPAKAIAAAAAATVAPTT